MAFSKFTFLVFESFISAIGQSVELMFQSQDGSSHNIARLSVPVDRIEDEFSLDLETQMISYTLRGMVHGWVKVL